MEDITGAPGELVDRFVTVVNGLATEGAWNDLGTYIVLALGGKKLVRAFPDTGREYPPGSVGAITRETSEVVSRKVYMDRIRDRLAELVLDHVDESFLVRSLRDHLRRQLESFADVDAGDRRRAEFNESMLKMAEDAGRIAAFRAKLAEDDPSAELLTDDQVAAQIREMAGRFGPTPVEAAVDRWATLAQWDELVSEHLSDDLIEEWLTLFLRLMTRG